MSGNLRPPYYFPPPFSFSLFSFFSGTKRFWIKLRACSSYKLPTPESGVKTREGGTERFASASSSNTQTQNKKKKEGKSPTNTVALALDAANAHFRHFRRSPIFFIIVFNVSFPSFLETLKLHLEPAIHLLTFPK